MIDHVLMVSWRINDGFKRKRKRKRKKLVGARERGGQRARVKGMLHAN